MAMSSIPGGGPFPHFHPGRGSNTIRGRPEQFRSGWAAASPGLRRRIGGHAAGIGGISPIGARHGRFLPTGPQSLTNGPGCPDRDRDGECPRSTSCSTRDHFGRRRPAPAILSNDFRAGRWTHSPATGRPLRGRPGMDRGRADALHGCRSDRLSLVRTGRIFILVCCLNGFRHAHSVRGGGPRQRRHGRSICVEGKIMR